MNRTNITSSATILLIMCTSCCIAAENSPKKSETLLQLTERSAKEVALAYQASPFSSLSKDYFQRFSRDPNTKADTNEVAIDNNWKIVLATDAKPLTEVMAYDLADFLARRMDIKSATEKLPADKLKGNLTKVIILLDSTGGDSNTAASFTVTVEPKKIIISGKDAQGLRDGVVKLVDMIGFRQAPFVKLGTQTFKPRLAVRATVVPWFGSCRDVAFMGFNSVILTANRFEPSYGKVYASEFSLYGLSTSDAIPELKKRRDPAALQLVIQMAKNAQRYGLKVYCFVNTKDKFPKDDSVFKAHPEIRGAQMWKADGDYTLCTEQPLVKQYLTESIEGIFKVVPNLAGVTVIVGGESFYHCFMRPVGVPKGHTTCPRCDALSAETVVSDMCNYLGEAARKVNPNALILAWPYSAYYVWSVDKTQEQFIKKLKGGAAFFTEIEKDETLQKPDGVQKLLWDYSIDLIGPSEKAKKQIEVCHQQGTPIFIKSEIEFAFEVSDLPDVPCMDRWADRAEVMANCGADGVFMFPYFRPPYATSAAEVGKFFSWQPVPDKEKMLQKFAARIAGDKAGPHLRKAWKYASDAIDFSPEIGSYFKGPHFLGPAHPMCADPNEKLSDIFYGVYIFMGEATEAEGLMRRPTFLTSPTGNVPVFAKFYRKMTELLKSATDEMYAAGPLVPQRCRLMFDAENSTVRWFYHTARSQANFYESCLLRDRLLALAAEKTRTPEEIAEAKTLYNRWQQVLLDEKDNAKQALSVVEADIRLDFSCDDTTDFAHAGDMIREKLKVIDKEINGFLPSVAKRCGIE